jgi:hypothetical protein
LNFSLHESCRNNTKPEREVCICLTQMYMYGFNFLQMSSQFLQLCFCLFFLVFVSYARGILITCTLPTTYFLIFFFLKKKKKQIKYFLIHVFVFVFSWAGITWTVKLSKTQPLILKYKKHAYIYNFLVKAWVWFVYALNIYIYIILFNHFNVAWTS